MAEGAFVVAWADVGGAERISRVSERCGDPDSGPHSVCVVTTGAGRSRKEKAPARAFGDPAPYDVRRARAKGKPYLARDMPAQRGPGPRFKLLPSPGYAARLI